MAERILAGGFQLSVWARRPASAEPFGRAGASVAASLTELGARCDVIGVCVVDDDDVRSVATGPTGLLAGVRPGTIVAVHSTVLPETCLEVADTLGTRGAFVLDAPVSGGATAALEGTLSVMVGGPWGVFERARPVFETYGVPVHLGPLGSGQRMKLLNNAVFMANLCVALEALDLGHAMGLDRDAAEEVLSRSSGGSRSLQSMARFRKLKDLGHVREMLAKDLGHFEDLADHAGEQPIAGQLGRALLERLAAMDASPSIERRS